MSSQPIQVLIVDDHAMVRKGLKALLQEYEGIIVVGEAPNGLKAIDLVERLKPDVVLLDLFIPDMDGIEAIKRMIAIRPHQRIVVLTAYAVDDKLLQAIKAGAMGYLVKDTQPEELIQSIRNVYAGEPSLNAAIAWKIVHGMSGVETPGCPAEELTERELEVLNLLTQGRTDQEIAQELVVAEVTIRTHVSRIISKLGLKNRVEAALYGIRSGMVSLGETSYMNEVCNRY